MNLHKSLIWSLFLFAPVIFLQLRATPTPEKEQHRLYVAVPGIRNDLEYGGVGILVYDIDVGYKFIKRIPTWDVPPGEAAENVKGTAASAKTGKLYVSTIKRRSEEHTSELQSRGHLVCRLLLEKKKI